MNTKKEKAIGSSFKRIDTTTLLILFFLGVIAVYYAMLYHETSQKIIKNGELSATKSSHQIDKYLSTGIEAMRLTCHALDNMIRDGRSQDDLQDFLINQSVSIESITSGNSIGMYGLINGEFLDGTGWVPDAGYVPVKRPWYIGARASIGRVALIDPYLDVRNNTMMITLAKTLCDAKSIVAMDFSIERIQAITEGLIAEDKSNIEIVLDRKYKVIAHSDKSEVGKSYIAEKETFGSVLVKKLRSSHENFFSFRFDDTDYIVYSMPVANNWLCLSVFNATSAFAPLRRAFILTIIVSFLVISVLIFIMNRYESKTRLAQLMNEKAERAAAASEAKTSFLSNMSHEIRTPINAVLGMNEMVLRESDDQKSVIEYSENIRTAGNTLLGLVNDILDFSKIEAGKMEIILADYDLSSVINDLVTMIQARAENKGLLLKLDFDETMPKQLNGDEVRIKQVVTNILTNAVKYTKEGSVTFHIGYERIPDAPEDVFLDIAISDTGIGIKPEDISKLFSEFERIEEKRNRNIEGTGLGMNITKRLLEMMGTSLKVESVYGEGSTFSFRLRQKVVSWEALGNYEDAYRASIAKRKKYHEKFTAPDALVLMVDDTPMNLKVFRSLLKRTKVQVDTAGSGDEGLELMKNKKYDLIFLDHMMPEKDGIETLHELKADTNNPNLHTTAVCLTANAISGAREKYLAEGFDDYLTKPIDTDELEEMMIKYLPEGKVIRQTSDGDAPGEPSVELPEWLCKIEEIDTGLGLQRCGGGESYLDLLKIYAEDAASNAEKIENFWRTRDLPNTTIKVHALKSTSRAIGADALGAEAERLELAGKAGDEVTLDADLDGLLERYRALGAALSPLYAPAKETQGELPLISENELSEAYQSIREFAENMDADSAEYALSYLDGFRIPEGEQERVEQLRGAIRDFDWDRVSEILS